MDLIRELFIYIIALKFYIIAMAANLRGKYDISEELK